MANSQETQVNLKINRVPDKATLEDMVANNQLQPNQLYMIESEQGDGLVALQTKTLWTNPNPTSSFAAQTITVEDMSDYDYIILTNSHNDSSTPMIFNSQVLHINKLKDTTYSKGIECIWANVNLVFYRILNITSSTTISVNACYSGNTTYDDVCVPQKIIGIKLIESQTQITNKYSTEETVVGEWIDGKKIYRKTLSGTKTTSEVENVFDLSTVNFETLTNLQVIVKDVDNRWNTIYNYQSTDWLQVLVRQDRYVSVRSGSNYPALPYTYYITIEYTKTTD